MRCQSKKKFKLICQKQQPVKVFYIQHEVIDQNRSNTEKTATGVIVALVIWQGLNMEYLTACEVHFQLKCWERKGKFSIAMFSKHRRGWNWSHLHWEMCNLEKLCKIHGLWKDDARSDQMKDWVGGKQTDYIQWPCTLKILIFQLNTI